ncbi:wax ester/triacylglycerol synthase domain-containing protein [Cellulomonas fimi]|uniref:diacylglycerol O-acyltransferase n=3 Tax=Cellulomonas fimi TaxID=1708 RepID=F4GZR5_CELFA|nr:wax ester/triacylglycerol synthase domain-containing protein [Cellulomonas fimi]AEE47231.1 protein of unknown function UPF0089 [Cellulomonas fimi ATCC 484]VEH35664.1 acyltransferase, WS/DGAT/MGAT [Cellulomonas fimi]
MKERLTVFDRAELATDVGPNPRHITVLLELGGPAPDVDDVRRRMLAAVAQQPRLTARVRARTGTLRRRVWETGAVDVDRHVVAQHAPGADPVALAVADLGTAMPPDRPPWRLTVVDLAAERSALVWTSHHLLGNGPSLLTLLVAALSDAPPDAPWRAPGRRPRPVTGADGRGRPGRAGRSPLLREVTGGIAAAPVSVDAAAVRAGARTCGATVNDALLWAWARAYRRADLARGGPGERVVLSVPVTVPGSRFGNHVGTLRVAVPALDEPGGATALDDDAAAGLAALAARTRHAKRRVRPWAWPLAPLGVLALRRLGVLPSILRRQRLISTVVTHAPGPPAPVRFLGLPLVATVPLVPVVGNVTTCAVALSVDGRLDVAVVCSPESADLVDALARDLRAGLDDVAALARRLP